MNSWAWKFSPPRDFQDYHSMYIDLYNEFRNKNKGDAENVNDDIVFEMELIKSVEINIDYILMLIRKYHKDHMKDKEILITIQKSIDSSIELRNKKDLIENFINTLSPRSRIDEDWKAYVEKSKKDELDKIIKDENLNPQATEKFVSDAFRDGYVQTSGTAVSKILPPVSIFSKTGERTKKRESVLEKLTAYWNRFKDLI